MVERPLDIQQTIKPPADHLAVCEAAGMPTKGNAAGNTEDFLDMTGANVSPAPLPDGFTPRGIVALVFSILAAFIGIAVIAWYGAGEFPQRGLGKPGRGVVNEAK
ncbi:MAG: hypothetical protein M4579_005168 [Chaenotheca gracillima]|nr:MAG: hypothetical protein M4579_005168 [Chaenotheca gracillima]